MLTQRRSRSPQEFTSYYFAVPPAALRGALARFSSQFRAPLCLKDAITREARAVHSEYEERLSCDDSRLEQLLHSSARMHHPAATFSYGNHLSLVDKPREAGVDVHARVKGFYEEKYSADRMAAVVMSGHEVHVLEGWAREMFDSVASKSLGMASFKEHGEGDELVSMTWCEWL